MYKRQTLALAKKGLVVGILPASAVYQLENPDLTLLKIDDEALTTERCV